MSESVFHKGEVVVLTGAAGKLATYIRPMLADFATEVRLCDKLPVEPMFANERTFTVALEDSDALASILNGATSIVHFAGYPREAEWDVILACNIVPCATLWEQARLAKIGRIVFASSNHSVGLYPREKKLDANDLPRADSRYGLSKVFMEAVAQFYSDKFAMCNFGIRIGHCADKPTDARMLSHWISPRDLTQLVRIGLTASYTSELVFGASGNRKSWWKNTRASELGYLPLDSADTFIDELAGYVSDNPVAEFFQGGSFASHEYENKLLKDCNGR